MTAEVYVPVLTYTARIDGKTHMEMDAGNIDEIADAVWGKKGPTGLIILHDRGQYEITIRNANVPAGAKRGHVTTISHTQTKILHKDDLVPEFKARIIEAIRKYESGIEQPEKQEIVLEQPQPERRSFWRKLIGDDK